MLIMVCLTATLLAPICAAASGDGLQLVGTVLSEAGNPVERANVFIRTAGPRKGVGVLCPSCYADCQKKAITDDRGKFTLKDLDPELTFELLVVADGFVPTFTPKRVDPRSDEVSIALQPHDLDKRDRELVVHGCVRDESGKPVGLATVKPFGFLKGDTGQYGGRPKGIDPLAVTNPQGEFRIGISEKDVSLLVRVHAPVFAPRTFLGLRAGQTHELKLPRGTTVTGKVTKDGQPLSGIVVGLVQQDTEVTGFVGDFTIATNHLGEFGFLNVPTQESYFVYGVMESCRQYGAIPRVSLDVGSDDQSTDIGTLAVEPAHRLTGQVLLSDGKAVPDGTRVLIGRDEAWDSQQSVVTEDGRFAFDGLPKERYRLSVNVPGYHISPKNESYNPVGGLGLLGTVTGDIDGLRVLLDPGPRQAPDSSRGRRKDTPLQGIP